MPAAWISHSAARVGGCPLLITIARPDARVATAAARVARVARGYSCSTTAMTSGMARIQ